MRNQARLYAMMIAIIFALVAIFGLTLQSTQASPALQSTATATATATATNTPTPTATPIATALPMFQSLTGFAQGQRVGQYGISVTTSGDAFQGAAGSGISLYSSTGRQTFHVAGDTGKITGTGITVGSQATYTSGSYIANGMVTTATVCFISPSPEITATYTITATGFSSNTASRSNPIYWMCVQ